MKMHFLSGGRLRMRKSVYLPDADRSEMIELPGNAIGDFAAAVRLKPSDAIGVILLHLARVRAQQSDDQEFGANVGRVDRREWPGRLVVVLTGEATANQVGDGRAHGHLMSSITRTAAVHSRPLVGRQLESELIGRA